jgi:hypothetical protein
MMHFVRSQLEKNLFIKHSGEKSFGKVSDDNTAQQIEKETIS